MRTSIHRLRGRPRLCLTGALAVLLLFLSSSPAAPATPVPPDPTGGPITRGNAYMGIGVLAHDGASDAPPPAPRATQTEGVDVSSHQGEVDWPSLWDSGVRWAYTKATEGTYYTNPYFTQQYDGSFDAGMVRGAYHFATPDTAGGAAQADYFLAHGGGWSADGKTLPGVLDIEWNPYGDACYGKSASAMVTWIRDFLDRYKSRTGRAAVVYTATSWWSECTGNYAGFGPANPLWIARYASTVGTLPAGWSSYTMWQYTSSGPSVGDHDRFNGSQDKLREFATG